MVPCSSGQNAGLMESRGATHLFGNLLMILSILVWTAYTLWSKKVLDHIPSKMGFLFHAFHLRTTMRKYSPFFLTGILCVVSLISLAPMAFIEIASIKGVNIPNMERVSESIRETYQLPSFEQEYLIPMAGVFYMGIFSTLVAYGMYEWALKDMPVAESAIYSYLSPLFGIPVGYILLGEIPGVWYILGGLIIAFGVYISEKQPAREAVKAE
jgi:drug/metabolite transporter (DMT)-like permease